MTYPKIQNVPSIPIVTNQIPPNIQNYYLKKSIDAMYDAEKQKFSNDKKLELLREQQNIKETYREFRQTRQEILTLDKDGNVICNIINGFLPLKPIRVSNMQSPCLTTFYCAESDIPIYRLTCDVDGIQKEIFLHSAKIKKGNYLLQKLNSIGIYFLLKNAQREKYLVTLLITKLIASCTEEITLPMDFGWYITENNEIYFIEKEDLTWKKIQNLAK